MLLLSVVSKLGSCTVRRWKTNESLGSRRIHCRMALSVPSRLVHSEVTRELPTSFAAAPLIKEIAPSDDLPPVWPWRDGETGGIALEPLYKNAPAAALRDPVLCQSLALVDAIRDGRAHQRRMAERYLIGCAQEMSKHNPHICSLRRLAFAQPLLGELAWLRILGSRSQLIGYMVSLELAP